MMVSDKKVEFALISLSKQKQLKYFNSVKLALVFLNKRKSYYEYPLVLCFYLINYTLSVFYLSFKM